MQIDTGIVGLQSPTETDEVQRLYSKMPGVQQPLDVLTVDKVMMYKSPGKVDKLATSNRPDLSPPTGGTGKAMSLDHNAILTRLMGEMAKLTGEASAAAVLRDCTAAIYQCQAIAYSYNVISKENDALKASLKVKMQEFLGSPGALDTEVRVLDEAVKTNTQALEAYRNLSQMQAAVQEKHINSSIAVYIELMSMLINLIGKNNETSIDNQRKLNEQLNNANLSSVKKQAEEIERKNKIAQILNKSLSILGIVLGAILGLTSIIISGGALFPLIAGIVCLSISIADSICLGIKDKTAMGMLTELISKNMTELMTNDLSDDEKDLENFLTCFASVFATIITTAPTIANAAALCRAVNMSKVATEKFLKVFVFLNKYAFLQSTVNLTGNISVSALKKMAADEMAEMSLTENEISHVKQLLEEITERFESNSESEQLLLEELMKILGDRTEASQQLARVRTA